MMWTLSIQFVEKYYEGCEVVYACAVNGKQILFSKGLPRRAFYKLMLHMGVEIVYNHADYRLMSRRALDEMEALRRSTCSCGELCR